MPKEINWEKRFERERKEKKRLQNKIYVRTICADMVELRFILSTLELLDRLKNRP